MGSNNGYLFPLGDHTDVLSGHEKTCINFILLQKESYINCTERSRSHLITSCDLKLIPGDYIDRSPVIIIFDEWI